MANMKGKILCAVVVAFSLLLASKPAAAHHSFSAEFDANKSVTIEGVITKVDWINPHGWWHVDVTNPDGTVDHWDIQSESPGNLRRAGMTRENSGKPGEKVKIVAFGAKDGTRNLAIIRTITFEDTGVTFRMLADFTK
jgi:hypothetical protein